MAGLPKRELARLTVVLWADGEVTVNGPLSEKMQCYGMLDCAKDAIRGYQAPAQPLAVQGERIAHPNGSGNGG